MKQLKVKVVEIPIDQISENVGQIPDVPANPRSITDEAFELLKKSIDESPEMNELDEVEVYLYNGMYIAISGNHRLRAYKELGWKKVLCKLILENTPPTKLREYIMKKNMQYAQNDPYKLQSWEKSELDDWGVDMPVMQSDLNVNDFFKEESENHHLPQEGFKVTVTCPKSLSDKKEEIINLLKEVMKNYGGVKVG